MDPEKPDPEAERPAPSAEVVDRRLLELLVCPVTKTRLEYDAARQELISRAAALAFPIRDGVPLMTLEAARPLEKGPAAASKG